MAIVSLKDVKVGRVFFEGKGAEFVEEFQTRSGETGTKKYSAFFDEPHGLSVGDTGNVSGLLSVKASLWEREDGDALPVADIVLNSPRFEATGGSDDGGPF